MSGFAHNEAKNGPSQSYSLDPRGKIFRRGQGAITDLTGMKQIMQVRFIPSSSSSLQLVCSLAALAVQRLGEGPLLAGRQLPADQLPS